MRVLMLTDLDPVVDDLERHVWDLSAELVRSGHHVALVILQHDRVTAVADQPGIQVYRLRGGIERRVGGLCRDPWRRYALPMPDPLTSWALARILGSEQPEIVHAHSDIVRAFLPLKQWSGAKLVVCLHDTGTLRAPERALVDFWVPAEQAVGGARYAEDARRGVVLSIEATYRALLTDQPIRCGAT
ncbi:MAG: glycosyltransferase [Chloroflexi bacterium]|nr:glycosyltransferase [Chloroflexota bacterium]